MRPAFATPTNGAIFSVAIAPSNWIAYPASVARAPPAAAGCCTTLSTFPRQPRGTFSNFCLDSQSRSDHHTDICRSSPSGALGVVRASVTDVLNLGRAHILEGDVSSSVESFRRAVEIEPRHAVARAELGRALVRCGRRAEGFESLAAAYELDSLCPGAKDGFREYYRAEIEADPGNLDMHEGLAALCIDSAWPEEAARCYQACLDLESSLQGDHISGVDCDDDVRRARRDRWSVALFKCHTSLCSWDDWDAEARAVRAAVRRHTKTGIYSRGFVVGIRGEDEEASARTADIAAGGHGRTVTSNDGNEGSNASDDGSSSVGSPGVRPALHPFDSLSAPLTIEDCFVVAEQQSQAVLAEARMRSKKGSVQGSGEDAERKPAAEKRQEISNDENGGRLRLGYVTGDLMGTHPLTHLMQSTFGMHDRRSFEVFLYALNPSDGSAARRRVEEETEHFRDLSALTACEAAELISSDGITLLVNLNGYAGTARSADIFALRPAAIAISYMGFPGTMGSPDVVDYILADGVVIPPDMRPFYSEKVLEMPDCYFVNDYRQSELAAISCPIPRRSDHGLPPMALSPRDQWGEVVDSEERTDHGTGRGRSRGPGRVRAALEYQPKKRSHGGGVVLCNFNRWHKIDPHTFSTWMEVLRNVPGTVLWLLDGGETACLNLRRQACREGVDESRLVFAPLVGKEEHLKRLRLADLFVDTPLYNAHTVGCDALWAGVPMVTLKGDKMASRVGASLVEAAGLPELVTDTLEAYRALVQELASNDQRRGSMRRKLEKARFTCPLFDTQKWVIHAEEAFRRALDRHEAGHPPVNMRVGESRTGRRQ